MKCPNSSSAECYSPRYDMLPHAQHSLSLSQEVSSLPGERDLSWYGYSHWDADEEGL